MLGAGGAGEDGVHDASLGDDDAAAEPRVRVDGVREPAPATSRT